MVLAILSLFLFGPVLCSHFAIFGGFQSALLSVEWMLLLCLAVWCGTFLFLAFHPEDLPLISLLLVAIIMYFMCPAPSLQVVDASVLLAGITLGKGTHFALVENGGLDIRDREKSVAFANRESAVANSVVGIVGLLALSAWWHLRSISNYHGPRWVGLWDHPNIYGILMGTGTVLTIGLLSRKGCEGLQRNPPSLGPFPSPRISPRWVGRGRDILRACVPYDWRWGAGSPPLRFFLLIAAGMLGIGLVMSYSRGAWMASTAGLLYVAWSYGKLKWRTVALGVGMLALGALCLWGRTPDSAPWYIKRLDLGRPSAQHRVSAWRGALQMMRDHPMGVGWNREVDVYEKHYSPPADGAAAITTNDYLMLGTQLGVPALFCFVVYVGLCLRGKRRWERSGRKRQDSGGGDLRFEISEEEGLRIACRAGAIVLLVAFWFDGGLFTLATGAVFWVLLELGREGEKTIEVRR